MSQSFSERVQQIRHRLTAALNAPFLIGLLPAVLLGMYWLGGETALVSAALVIPLLCLAVSRFAQSGRHHVAPVRHGLIPPEDFESVVEHTFVQSSAPGLMSAVFTVEIDENDLLAERYGTSAVQTLLGTIGDRLAGTLRTGDVVSRIGDYRFGICLGVVRQLDLELCIQLAGRLQTAVEEPVSVDGSTVYVTASVGFCQHTRMIKRDARSWLEAADIALQAAVSNGPGAIRAYSADMRRRSEARATLREDVTRALERGEICAWFQPQISTDTGQVSGFEALTRWNHPVRGMVSPAEFLPAIEQAGLLENLADVMLGHALTALKSWDAAGISVPRVGVNFAGPELNNPGLVEKLKWEFDRFDLSPDRLAVEVLETVVARAPDDMITRNVNALNTLGCQIDLDDFGTGHASIASVRRFAVSRIKIDRSFVIRSDRDPEQQRMISAILTMAERLGVETLAEGVETAGEHALLAQLGCDHVQGFGIGKPMPFDQTLDWIAAHTAKLEDAPRIPGNKPG